MKNKIPFFVQTSTRGFIDNSHNHKKPTEFPSFVLVQDDTWNDFGFKTDFYLFYYENKESVVKPVGFLKIGYVGKKTISNTVDKLPSRFLNLTKYFVSISPSGDFYTNVTEIFGDKYRNVLYALNDMSFISDLYNTYKGYSVVDQSLFRSDATEKKVRTGKYIAEKGSQDIYNINYLFTPKYRNDDNSKLDVSFDFSEELLFNRIYGVIGKNGVGKTLLLSDIPKYIIENWDDNNTPRYSKIFSIYHDKPFYSPKDLINENIEYNHIILSENKEESGNKIKKSIEKIKLHDRTDKLKKILEGFLDEENINNIFEKSNDTFRNNSYKINEKAYIELKSKLSSGQKVIFNTITEIVANIRYDTLLLLDEPETYLHPNFISQFTTVIYDLTKEFKSFCIIATHSPIVIQGLFSKNIYIMEKVDNIVLNLRKPDFETFGQNLTVLTENIFGNVDFEKQYEKVIDELYGDIHATEKSIIEKLEKNNISLTLNARIYLKNKFN